MKIIILALAFLSVSSCRFYMKDHEAKQLKKTYQEFSKKELKFPDSVLVYYRKNGIKKQSIQSYSGNQMKIVTHVAGDCGRCVNNLKRWEEEIIEVIDTNLVKVLIFLYVEDFSNFTNLIDPEITINFPLVIDTLNLFVVNNDLPRFDERFHTFLINENNNIILIGSPLHSEKLKTLYLNEIKRR